MMRTGNGMVNITEDDIQLLIQIGVSKAYIRKALPEHLETQVARLIGAPRSTNRGLSDTEIAILRRGGARGLDDSPKDGRCLRDNFEALIKECRAFVTTALDTATVASMLGLSLEEVVTKAREAPPSLAVFEVHSGTLKFPQWQFNESRLIPHLPDLLALAPDHASAFGLARFMCTPHVDLDIGTGRLSPCAWLISGLNPKPVLTAIKAMSED